MKSRYPLVDIAGTPSEMGVLHGKQLADRIHLTARFLREKIGPEPYEASWEDFQQTVCHCRKYVPRLIQEMEGIAKGADIPFREVFLINAHLDLNVWKRVVWDCPKEESSACSSHALTTEDEVYLAWNGDDWTGWLDCGAVVRGKPDNGIPFVYWSLAGSVGRPGMNSHLALGANSLPSPKWHAEGLLYPILSRLLLSCQSAGESVALLQSNKSCSAMNYMVADKDGDLVDIEVGSDSIALRKPPSETSHLLHTNCYLDAGLAGGTVDENTVCLRLGTARSLYRELPPGNAEEITAILSDHTGGICVHRDGAATIVSFVAEIHRGNFHVITGNPCQGSPETINLLQDT